MRLLLGLCDGKNSCKKVNDSDKRASFDVLDDMVLFLRLFMLSRSGING